MRRDWLKEIEPAAAGANLDADMQLEVSRAISLKRIADVLERFSNPVGNEGFTGQLIEALSRYLPRG